MEVTESLYNTREQVITHANWSEETDYFEAVISSENQDKIRLGNIIKMPVGLELGKWRVELISKLNESKMRVGMRKV